MLTYLRFLLQSTNQHGVHSPFVYSYLTKGIYENTKYRSIKHPTSKWLLNSINYFHPKTFCCLDDQLNDILQKNYHSKSSLLKNADVIIESYHFEKQNQLNSLIKDINNSQILLIALYSYPKSFVDELRENPEITLVVDFYYGCLISKRKEQLKQNFFLRV